MSSPAGFPQKELPAVSIVYLVFNRRQELRESLRRMTDESDYPSNRVEVIVVDNASTDDSSEMVRSEFPGVRLIRREQNVGVSGWNDGLAVATGDYVLALDDDCYLGHDGLRAAVNAAIAIDADLVSFKVVSTEDPSYEFTHAYRTGLFMFWGCAVLMRRRVVDALGGYDPEIFVWANELEFTMRLFDSGFRHLHLPEVIALHMKPVPPSGSPPIDIRGYRINGRHWGYIAGKLMTPGDAAGAVTALVAHAFRDSLRVNPVAVRAIPDILAGFIHGLRRRQPLRSVVISHFYRENFLTFASPWHLSRRPAELLRSLPKEIAKASLRRHPEAEGPPSQRDEFFLKREVLYPTRAAWLDFSPAPVAKYVTFTC